MDQSCSSNPVTCWISNQVDILSNIASNMESVQRMISGAAYLIGLAFAFKAIYSLKKYCEQRSMMSNETNIKDPLAHLLVAGILIYLPTGIQMMLVTTFGQPNILAYAPISSNNSSLDVLFGQDSAVGASLSIIIQTIGLIAFIRGWVLVARSASQGQPPGGTGKGLVHVFGGILAMNIVGTIQVINNTLYGTAT